MLTPAAAAPGSGAPDIAGLSPAPAEQAQFSRERPRDFNRCMREKYGPRYFRGVKRAHRTFMAQACGG